MNLINVKGSGPDDELSISGTITGKKNIPRFIVFYVKAVKSTGLRIRYPWSGMPTGTKPITRASLWIWNGWPFYTC